MGIYKYLYLHHNQLTKKENIMRIQKKDLERKVSELNHLFKTKKTNEFRLDEAYGGITLIQMEGSAARKIFPIRGTKKEIFYQLSAMLRGAEMITDPINGFR